MCLDHVKRETYSDMSLRESQYSSRQASLWLFFPLDHDSTLPNLHRTLVPESRLPASLPKVLRSLFPFSWVGGKVSNPLLPKLPTFLSATLGIPFFSAGADERLPFLNLTPLGTPPSVAYSPSVAPKPVWGTWELGVPWAYTGLVAASAAPREVGSCVCGLVSRPWHGREGSYPMNAVFHGPGTGLLFFSYRSDEQMWTFMVYL